jgi:hypothetical protein
MKKDFVKVKDVELAQQLSRFHSELSTRAAALGFSDAEIEEARKDADAFAFIDYAHGVVGEFYKTVTAFKTNIKAGIGGPVQEFPTLSFNDTISVNVPDGIVTRFRAKAAKAKSSPAYTEAIGIQLGIEGVVVPEENPDLAKPVIGGLSIIASNVTLKWKKGIFDGIRVFKKVDNGEYRLTGFSISPPYTDRSPITSTPQVWSYAIQYIIDDDEVGLLSDPASITVSNTIAAV